MIRSFRDFLQVLGWSAVVLVGIVGVLRLLGWFGYDYVPINAYNHMSISDVARITRVTLPNGSEILHSVGSMRDFRRVGDWRTRRRLWLEAELDPRKVGWFIHSLKEEAYLFSRAEKDRALGGIDAPSGKNGSVDWWKKDSVEKFISGHQYGEHDETTILIDLDNPKKPRVYLSYYHEIPEE